MSFTTYSSPRLNLSSINVFFLDIIIKLTNLKNQTYFQAYRDYSIESKEIWQETALKWSNSIILMYIQRKVKIFLNYMKVTKNWQNRTF